MGRLADLLKGAAGEKSIHSAIGRWRQAVSGALDTQAAEQFFSQAIPDGQTTFLVTLPEPELTANYFVDAVFVAGTPQAFSVSAVTPTAFTLTFPAATAASVILDIHIQQKN